MDTTERGVGGAREGDFTDNFIVMLSFMLDLIFKINFVNIEVLNYNREKGVKGLHKDGITL